MKATAPLPLKTRIESRFLKAMLGLPPTVLRRLAGKPVTVDGATLDDEPQLMLRLDRISGTPEIASLPIPQGRKIFNRRSRIVCGDSAGGNLAALTALHAAGTGLPPAFQLLIYPGTDFTRTLPSHAKYGEGLILTQQFINLAAETYLNGADEKDRRKWLPPASRSPASTFCVTKERPTPANCRRPASTSRSSSFRTCSTAS
jgi:hypothetical protein